MRLPPPRHHTRRPAPLGKPLQRDDLVTAEEPLPDPDLPIHIPLPPHQLLPRKPEIVPGFARTSLHVPRPHQLPLQGIAHLVAPRLERRQALVLQPIEHALHGRSVGRRVRVAVEARAGPERDGAAGPDESGGAAPEGRHVEPMCRRGGREEVDTGCGQMRGQFGPREGFGAGDGEMDWWWRCF